MKCPNIIIKEAEKDEYGVEKGFARGTLRSTVPFGLGSETIREHPVTSILLGRAGGLGAKAKDTGKNYREEAIVQNQIPITLGLALNAYRQSGGSLRQGFYGGMTGAIAAPIASSLQYGLGRLLGKKKKAKKVNK